MNGAPSADGSAGASTPAQLSPQLLEWARQQFNPLEFAAGLREVQETGGLELKDFVQELEQEAAPDH
jgi:hypothetical protein